MRRTTAIEQYKERLHEKLAGRFGEHPSGHKPQFYSDAPAIPPVAVPVTGVLILLKSSFTSIYLAFSIGFASARSAHHTQFADAPHAIKFKGEPSFILRLNKLQ
jgi:hypothetical protein